MELNHTRFLDQLPDAVIAADRDGTIRYWNPAAEKVFGFSAAEALDQNLDLIIPAAFRDAHWRGFERALETGVTKYAGQALPTKSLHKSGNDIYVELSFSIVMNNGVAEGALACAREITARFTQERDNRRRMRALEAELEQLRSAQPGAAPAVAEP